MLAPVIRSGRLRAWLVAVLVSFVVIALLLGDALTSDGDVTSNPESKQAEALIHESFPPEPTPSEIVVVRSDRYTVDDPAFEAKVLALSERGEALAVVADAQSYYASDDESLVSKDRPRDDGAARDARRRRRSRSSSSCSRRTARTASRSRSPAR